jgi:hypothetical protein
MRKIAMTCLLLQVVSITAAAQTADGYVPFQCPMTGDSRLHLTTLNGQTRLELVLRIPEQRLWGGVDLKEWYDYPGEECSSGTCSAMRHSRVQILHVSYGSHLLFVRRSGSISGDFEVELRDGKKLRGPFRAKLRNPRKAGVCE